jgi:hypothetical protein
LTIFSGSTGRMRALANATSGNLRFICVNLWLTV